MRYMGAMVTMASVGVLMLSAYGVCYCLTAGAILAGRWLACRLSWVPENASTVDY